MTDTVHNLPRLLRTLRPLRLVQVWGRVWMRVYRPRVDARPAPPLRAANGTWRGCARAPSMLGPAIFRFLNIEHTLESAADWNRADWPRLWRYNLHYFDDLAAGGLEIAPAGPVGPSGPPAESLCRRAGRSERSAWQRDLITRWITDNPPTHGAGWEPYPTSLRIVNWIKWTLAGNALAADALQSLAIQTRWLRKRLEFHLLGNHLWANAKALVFAGVFFDNDEADRWSRRGMALLRRELAEQILPDGGHIERSPMYHAIVLEDLLDLVQLAALYPARFNAVEVDRWRQTAARMLRWLRVMTHPDGGIALFNDAALGIAPDYAALAEYAKQLGVVVDDAPLHAIEALPDSGYVRLQTGDAMLIADVGEIGPDYLPGHAHADTLGFELSLAGERVLVNGGTSTYEANAERLRQRGTAAHNTVVVDGKDSSEVWSAFRVGRRAHPINVTWGEDNEGLWLRAAHDGYAHLPGSPIHHREWRLSEHGLIVTDRIDGNCEHAEARFRLAPAWRLAAATAPSQPAAVGAAAAATASHHHHERTIHGDAPHGRDFRPSYNGPGEAPEVHAHTQPAARVIESSYHPGFSLSQPCQLIEVPLDSHGSSFTLRWH
jgi:uncharacterized heparinase superfamily protein